MKSDPDTGSGGAPTWGVLRLSMRAANRFLLDAVGFASAGRDIMDNLILVAIVQANVSPIMADPELQLRYATADSPPPDELRRPISINAVAASLNLPFETVRRRVAQLADKGTCEVTPRGLMVPQREVIRPAHIEILEINQAAVKDLYLRLRRNACLSAPQARRPAPPQPPIRAVARISSDFLLRLTESLVSTAGNLVDGLTLMAVFDLNTAGLSDQDRGDETAAADGFVPDDRRRPATVREVAERLGLPYEQTRRRLASLTAEGRCIRTAGGYAVTAQTLARPDLLEVYRRGYLGLQRMFAALAELGVLAEWEDELTAGDRP